MSRILDSLMRTISKCLEFSLIVLVSCLVIDVLFQVAARYLFSSGVAWTEELAVILLVWVSLCGAALGFIRGSHLGIDLFGARFSPAQRTVAGILIHSVTFLFAAVVMVYGGGQLVSRTLRFRQVTAALGIGRGYVYLVLPLSGLCIAQHSLQVIYKILRRQPLCDTGRE